jgi:hypothetical protein
MTRARLADARVTPPAASTCYREALLLPCCYTVVTHYGQTVVTQSTAIPLLFHGGGPIRKLSSHKLLLHTVVTLLPRAAVPPGVIPPLTHAVVTYCFYTFVTRLLRCCQISSSRVPLCDPSPYTCCCYTLLLHCHLPRAAVPPCVNPPPRTAPPAPNSRASFRPG